MEAPTQEQLRVFRYDRPAIDQKQNRPAYRRVSQALDLYHRGDIDDGQYRAAEKLYMHLVGATGARVQHDEANDPLNADTEYPIIYHGQKVALAKAAVGSARTWRAVHDLVMETRTVRQIGTRAGIGCHKMSRGLGLGLIISGLDTLAVHWGLIQRKPPD